MADDDRVKALHELVAGDHVSEALVLATCNRIEVFAEVERFHGGVADVSRVLARQAGATVEELSPYVTVHYEDQAVSHLFTVADGLDSMVVGETQVLPAPRGVRPGPRGGDCRTGAAPGGPARAPGRQAGAHRDRHR